jgi:hypothetical protein
MFPSLPEILASTKHPHVWRTAVEKSRGNAGFCILKKMWTEAPRTGRFFGRFHKTSSQRFLDVRPRKTWLSTSHTTSSKHPQRCLALSASTSTSPYVKGDVWTKPDLCGVVLQAWTEGVSPPARDFRNAPRGSGWPLGAASERDRPPARSDALIPEHIRRDYVFAPENPSNLPMQRRKARSPWPIMQRIVRRRDECTLANGLASPALRRADLPVQALQRETPGGAAGRGQGLRASMKAAGTHERSLIEITRNPKIFCNPHMRPLTA